ncbi:high mobility group box domain-containing protein [Pilobolus umbonatus]|nr:high mobility group box domain-containing protein [Pilobolus umbonatus]
MAEDIKYKLKYDDLKRRFRDIEEENDMLQHKLSRAKKNIKRFQIEKVILLERLNKSSYAVNDDNNNNNASYDSMDSEQEITPNDYEMHIRVDRMVTNKAPRKKRDPNAPKGPGNVFFLFCRLERDKIKDEYPDENIGDVTRLLGVKWKGLSKEGKQVYYDIFKKEMKEYEIAMKSYKTQDHMDKPIERVYESTPSASTVISLSLPNIHVNNQSHPNKQREDGHYHTEDEHDQNHPIKYHSYTMKNSISQFS